MKTQGEVLFSLFSDAGYEVTKVSCLLNRYLRLLDIVACIVRNRSKFDILVIEVYGGPSFVVEHIASSLGRLLGIRIIMWLHGGALPEFMDRFPRWTKRVLRKAEFLVTPSQYLARAISKHGFKARIIPNCIDLSNYRFRQRKEVKPRLFWMRSFHPIWNPFMAIRVLARLKEFEPGASLVMAGQDKGLQLASRRLAQELGLAESVRFPGFLNDGMKVTEGNAADIFINTNHVDNMPVAVVEACAMGLPVVTTAAGGIADLFRDGETALLVPVDDDEAMVKAIKRLINEPDLTQHISTRGRQLAEQSSWAVVRPQWERLFSDLGAGVST